jgi:hypothetical protein
VVASPSNRLGGEVDLIDRNQIDDMVLMLSIYHVPRGEKDDNSSTLILSKKEREKIKL